MSCLAVILFFFFGDFEEIVLMYARFVMCLCLFMWMFGRAIPFSHENHWCRIARECVYDILWESDIFNYASVAYLMFNLRDQPSFIFYSPTWNSPKHNQEWQSMQTEARVDQNLAECMEQKRKKQLLTEASIAIIFVVQTEM